MRAVSNAVMAALVVFALLWGNCYSCPQILGSFRSQSPSHGCCHRSKAPAPECRTQVLAQFQKTDPVDSVPALLPVLAATVQFVSLYIAESEAIPSIEHLPPGDLFSLRI